MLQIATVPERELFVAFLNILHAIHQYVGSPYRYASTTNAVLFIRRISNACPCCGKERIGSLPNVMQNPNM